MLPRVLGAVGLAALVCACASTGANSDILPLRTLRLYETGVGYFERSGDLGRGNGDALPVPAGHLDDALETLVVLGGGGKATVHGVEFGSSISRGMARTLAGLSAEAEAPISMRDLLFGLKGARIEVRAEGRKTTGRLVDVVDAKVATFTLVLFTDGAALVRVPSADIESVRPLDPSYAPRLGSALDALSTRGAQSRRLLHVLASGGPVTLGYVAETPVWRTTYRLVLDPSAGGVLQGWALVHNDTDEDWRGVRVELVNGRPDSFLFPLAAPRYARRQLVAPDTELATVPQLMDTTADAIWGDRIGDSFGAGGLGLTGTGEGGGGHGEGLGLGSFGAIGHGVGSGSESSSLLDQGSLAAVVRASGVEAGALFVYGLPEAVSLHGHASALLPFLQQRIDALPIAWVDVAGDAARSAVRLVNSTAQTLPAGTIAFFGDGGFAGESALDRLKPGERRFITYGVDLDVELRTLDSRATDEPKRLVWDKDGQHLEEHYLHTSDLRYAIENRSGRGRALFLAMRMDSNAKLTGADDVDFDARTSRPVAIFRLEPHARVERATHSVEGLVRRTPFASLTSGWMGEAAASPSLAAGDKTAATEAAARLKEAEDDAKATEQTKAQIADADRDVTRLREDMKALSGERPVGGGQANPFAARVLAAEDRLASLRKKLEGLEIDEKNKRDSARVAMARLTR